MSMFYYLGGCEEREQSGAATIKRHTPVFNLMLFVPAPHCPAPAWPTAAAHAQKAIYVVFKTNQAAFLHRLPDIGSVAGYMSPI